MTDITPEGWERRLHETAQAFSYPPTPDIARRARRALETSPRPARPTRPANRRLAWALAVLVTALALLLSVPSVRAAIVDFIQVGVVRIFLVAPTTTPTATPQPSGTEAAAATLPPTATSRQPAILGELVGETTLEDARQKVSFPIRLPAYPSDLGPPDRVYVQDQGDDVVLLVWQDPARSNRVRLSLHILGPESWGVKKFEPTVIEETRVNGQPAYWTTGPYVLELHGGEMTTQRLVTGHVLIWAEGDLTYRLETDLSMDETVRIAESLRDDQ